MALLSACSAVPTQPVITDGDSDQVADALDACPGTKPNTPVGSNGCSVFIGVLDKLDFAPNDHRLNSTSRSALTELVSLLNKHADVSVRLGGHTDNRGSAKDNLALSKRRVMAVVKFLVANGIEGHRLKPFGFGESRPLESNATESGRAKNRRIEVVVVDV